MNWLESIRWLATLLAIFLAVMFVLGGVLMWLLRPLGDRARRPIAAYGLLLLGSPLFFPSDRRLTFVLLCALSAGLLTGLELLALKGRRAFGPSGLDAPQHPDERDGEDEDEGEEEDEQAAEPAARRRTRDRLKESR